MRIYILACLVGRHTTLPWKRDDGQTPSEARTRERNLRANSLVTTAGVPAQGPQAGPLQALFLQVQPSGQESSSQLFLLPLFLVVILVIFLLFLGLFLIFWHLHLLQGRVWVHAQLLGHQPVHAIDTTA